MGNLGIQSLTFTEIKAMTEKGESINQLTKDGCSLFTAFLEGCYGSLFKYGDSRKKILPGEYDGRGSLSKYQMEPLEKRNGNIIAILEWFIEHNVDLNLVDPENDNCKTPLSLTLNYEDYYMMKYLLEHGADPKVWYTPVSERHGEFEMELIHSLDCYMSEASGNVYRNEKRLVWLLMDYGMPVAGCFRYIHEAEEEYQRWHSIVDGKDPKVMSREELFDVLYDLSRRDIVDYDCIKEYLDCFTPWDEEHSYEKLFSRAYSGRNVELFKMLYVYCPHPNYASEYMYCDVLYDSQFINDYMTDTYIEELDEKEECTAIEGGLDKIRMVRFMFTHQDAVEEYRDKTGPDESMLREIRYKLDNEADETPDIQFQQYKRLFIELTAFDVYTDDYGPKKLKKFDLDRLDEYRMIMDGPQDPWKIYDHNDELAAVF